MGRKEKKAEQTRRRKTGWVVKLLVIAEFFTTEQIVLIWNIKHRSLGLDVRFVPPFFTKIVY